MILYLLRVHFLPTKKEMICTDEYQNHGMINLVLYEIKYVLHHLCIAYYIATAEHTANSRLLEHCG